MYLNIVVGYRPEGNALVDGQPVTDPALAYEAALVLGGGSLASDAQLTFHDGEPQRLHRPATCTGSIPGSTRPYESHPR
jgi:hypothetical protein